jgi:hypothetical protein
MRKLLITAVTFLLMATAFSQTKVYLIPTLHGLHKTNQQYNYDTIKAVVVRLNPDVIAVEIRPEDVKEDSSYLKSNYPFEMWMMPHWFAATTIEGFDWLGAELENKPIPPRYWQDQSRTKYLQRRLDLDSVYTARLKSCQLYTNDRMAILNSQSLKGIIASNDALLIKEYYNCLQLQLRGSDYEELTAFYTMRNKKMMTRLDALFQKHSGKTIVVLMGDDHYPYLLEHLKKSNVTIGRL